MFTTIMHRYISTNLKTFEIHRFYLYQTNEPVPAHNFPCGHDLPFAVRCGRKARKDTTGRQRVDQIAGGSIGHEAL